MILRPLDREVLRQQYLQARPFPFVKVEQFLDPACAAKIASAFPSFDEAAGQGKTFRSVNERKKVQITDARLFPRPIAQLNQALASPEFLSGLSYVTGIPDLVADEDLVGGGIHITGPAGRPDLHVYFHYIDAQ